VIVFDEDSLRHVTFVFLVLPPPAPPSLNG
jgi:hypothetical protein